MNSVKFLCLVVIVLVTGAMGLRESYKGAQRLAVYWGQNGAGAAFGKKYWEKPLNVTCLTTEIDIIPMAFMDIFWDSRQANLPDLNFANHCDSPISPKYPFLLRCPKIEANIKQCQKLGKKILLSLGGATGDGTLPSKTRAQKLALELWGMFLGGNKVDEMGTSLRPFGAAILDGLDFDIEGGTGPANYEYLFQELRKLMNSDPRKEYLITGAPQCPYPDRYLGPGPGTGLGDDGSAVDILYVQFYNNYCYPKSKAAFNTSLTEWLDYASKVSPHGPQIFIGLPASPRASSGARFYLPPDQLTTFYQGIRNKPGVGGIMLWDASWDQNNLINGRRYSDYVHDVLRNSYNPTTSDPFRCSHKANGVYDNPDDCTKYIVCRAGRQYDESCPAHYKFDPLLKRCRWAIRI